MIPAPAVVAPLTPAQAIAYLNEGRTVLDIVTEAHLTEFCAEHEIAHLPEDRRFEHFATYAVVRRYYSRGAFDTADLVVGEGGDTGIDAIAFIVNGTLITDLDDFIELANSSGQLDVTFLFVQAERSSSFDSSKIANLGYGVLDFFSTDPKLKRNAMVSAAAEIASAVIARSSKFHPGNPICRLFYVTTGKWVDDANLVARKNSVVSDLENTQAFREVTFEPVDALNLQKLYRKTRSVATREFKFNDKVQLPQSPGVIDAYIGYLPTDEFFKIIVDDTGGAIDRGLFIDNVRDWLSESNEVNKLIRETLESPAKSRFALMNNGVTIIVRDLKKTAYTFHISDYSIVNGCQTSHVLFNVKDSIGAEPVLVPVRLIHTTDETIINDIIKSTNRQTAVKEEQFFALKEFPKQLEQYFQAFDDPKQKLFYERRHRQYDSLGIEKTRIVTVANLIKAYAAMFLAEPHRTTRSYSSLKAAVGHQIFVKGHREESYYTAALALYKLEYLFRNGTIDTQYKPARFHIIDPAV
jgi:hypothetical protein